MTIAKGKTTKSFRTCANKGFHIKLPNGWIVSTQFGAGNYGDNYDMIFDSEIKIEDKYFGKEDIESDKVEIWAFKEGKDYPKEPLAYQDINQFLKFLNKVKRFK